MNTTRLDEKLARIKADPQRCQDFMICDAKDADMAFGATAPGPRRDASHGGGFKSRRELLAQMRAIIEQDKIDLMLGSVSLIEQLAVDEQRFAGAGPGRAIRANDATDVWALRGAGYTSQASRPFRSADLAAVMAAGIADLGLYSITFNNDLERDLQSLGAFRAFRAEARQTGFRYFLEVFNPNAPLQLSTEAMPAYVNDCIVRCLAGLTRAEQPQFLKVAYNGPAALEELVGYDDQLVVGILGGASGTTRDCFQLLHDARKHGARLALFGRKINLAEAPLTLIELMQGVTQGQLSPRQAVREYHAALAAQGITPLRSEEDDSRLTDPVLLR